MTLLRGLGSKNCRADLTGEWEFSSRRWRRACWREDFMAGIAAMTERMVKKAKEYDRDTIPGDYATLESPCPNCGGVVKETTAALPAWQTNGAEPCGFSQIARRPHVRDSRGQRLAARQKIGPLEGFRPAGWPFSEIVIQVRRRGALTTSPNSDFGDDKKGGNRASWWSSEDAALGPAPSVDRKCMSTAATTFCRLCPRLLQPTPSCTFKSGKIIPAAAQGREQMTKLLATGKTDLPDKFREHAHPPRLQGAPGVGQGGGQGQLRICASKVPATPRCS